MTHPQAPEPSKVYSLSPWAFYSTFASWLQTHLLPASTAPTATKQGLARSRSASGWPVESGFLTSCRKDFTKLVQVILRVRSLKLGTVKQRKGLRKKNQCESLGGAALAHWGSEVTVTGVSQGRAAVSSLRTQRKGGLGERIRAIAQDNLPLPSATLVASLTGPLRV